MGRSYVWKIPALGLALFLIGCGEDGTAPGAAGSGGSPGGSGGSGPKKEIDGHIHLNLNPGSHAYSGGSGDLSAKLRDAHVNLKLLMVDNNVE